MHRRESLSQLAYGDRMNPALDFARYSDPLVHAMSKYGNFSSIFLFAISYFSCLGQLDAVIVSTTTGNTDRPPEDPGWDNVVIVRGSSGVYLGNRWVLTAAHVNAGNVLVPDVGTFSAVGATRIHLENPPGMDLTSRADLIMFQIDADPALPPLDISSRTPSPGTEVIMAGRGRDRSEQGVFWNVRDRGGNRVWNETDEETEYFGYQTLQTNSRRWGTNLVESDDLFDRKLDSNNYLTLRRGAYDTLSVLTEFDGGDRLKSDQTIKGPDGEPTTAYESQAARNDSGGPIFFKEDEDWVVGGIILAISEFENQPGDDMVRYAVFGNLTFSADLSHYRDQIIQHYIRGDFDDDGILSIADLDLLTNAFQAGDNDPRLDLNRDRSVDHLDRVIWVEEIRNTFFGDANLDGQFGTSDLVQVFEAGQYEDATPGNSTWATGDWNGDGEFSTSDIVLALQGNNFEQGPKPSPLVVPEPQLAAFLFFWIAALAIKQLRQRS